MNSRHILKSLDGLSPEQRQQLRCELDSKIATATAKQPAGNDLGSIGAMREDAAELDEAVADAMRQRQRRNKPAKPATPRVQDEILRQMLADGLITRLPNPAADLGDDDEPVVIKGEPLSETIIRERR